MDTRTNNPLAFLPFPSIGNFQVGKYCAKAQT
jgi:hypothetical protein